MARVLPAPKLTAEVQGLMRGAAAAIPDGLWQNLTAQLNTSAPYLVSASGIPLSHANGYLRRREEGDLYDFSFRHLMPNSAKAFADSLAYFLNTYKEPTASVIHHHATTGKLLTKFGGHLESEDASLSASTIQLRMLVAREFTSFVGSELHKPESAIIRVEEAVQRILINDSSRSITYFGTKNLPSTRRRSPSLIYILPPERLLQFFNGFQDPIHRSIAKLIFATGLRRFEVASLTEKQILQMRPVWPGGPASLTVIGKGNKERIVELEPAIQQLLQRLLTSKYRMLRLKLAFARGELLNADTRPLFVNRFGSPMSGAAIADAFLRVSEWTGIKRTPHELRHEFATHYLLNAYKGIQRTLQRDQLDSWLARLRIDQASLAVIRLSRLLGHSSPETTKKTYLVALLSSDPSVRDAWCEHLDQLEIGTLD